MGEWEKNRAPPLKNSGESEKSPPPPGTYFRESLGAGGNLFPLGILVERAEAFPNPGSMVNVTVLHPNKGYFEPILPFTLLDQPFCAAKLFQPELQMGGGRSEPSERHPQAAGPAARPRDIPGVFTHLWKSRSVCLPL